MRFGRFGLIAVILSGLLLVTAAFGTTTIRYGIWMVEQTEGVKAQIAEFEKEHPDIHVQLEVIPWSNYWVKLQTMLAGENCWDVFAMSSAFVMDYIVRGALLEITPYIKRDHINLNAYPKSVLAIHEFKGRYYSLPRDYDTIALFYNKDAFDKAGLKYPDENWTWTDLLIAAQKLTIKDQKGNTIQWGITAAPGLNDPQAVFFPLILSNGMDIIDEKGHVHFDAPEVMAVTRLIRDLTKYGYAPKPTPNYEDYFISGKSAMLLKGSWMIGYYEKNIKSFRWGVVPLPIFGRKATISNSLGNVIWAKSKHKEAAWTFVKWLAGKKAAEILAKTGAVIPAYKGTGKIWLQNFSEEHRKDAEVFLKSVEFTFPWPRTLGENKWYGRLGNFYLAEILRGNMSVEDGLKRATQEINRIVDQVKKRYEK